jgi:beta-RFAP synthase
MSNSELRPIAVHVVAPSRLHFGLMGFGADGDQAGGVGAMVDRPGVRLTVRRSGRFEAVGQHSARVTQFAREFLLRCGESTELACRIEVAQSAEQHVGLGTGTQLGLAAVSALAAFLGQPERTADEMAELSGRGRRSSIGTHGFFRGGLLYEESRPPQSGLAPLQRRIPVPSAWRWLLACPRGQHGLHGDAEHKAFAELPPVSAKVTASLRADVCERMIPAIEAGDFDAFSESLYDYGVTAGNCFAARQGGPFAGPRLSRLVADMRDIGIRGVGQSSWGPTLFGLCASAEAADEYCRQLASGSGNQDLQFTIAAPNNQGADILCEF